MTDDDFIRRHKFSIRNWMHLTISMNDGVSRRVQPYNIFFLEKKLDM